MEKVRVNSLLPNLLQQLAIGTRLPGVLLNVLTVVLGVAFLSAMAQVAIPLPFTPVPITGQSFAVLLIALSFGSRLAPATLLSYLCVGWAGLPVFAQAKAGFFFPSFGYLLGMLLCAYVVGRLADLGWSKRLWSSLCASFVGLVCIFSVGLIGLSFFVPSDKLLVMGLYPFIPGAIIKTVLASLAALALHKSSSR